MADSDRHFWRPGGDSVRHAFRGRRWCGQSTATSVCGAEIELAAEPSESDWVFAPTCGACNSVLRGELPKPEPGLFG
ncbi:hypothetical protein [Saccharopolyspora gloriosae]|uniref:hypothetical protein n=1 Tax=Saccharopolyspora gloriosae TaxID=455344 RepID=UPI001FB85F28|nr:hypothetical protein [Saccharopolyspora gloriosae]